MADGLWQVRRHYGIPEDRVTLLEDLCSRSISAVIVDSELTVTVGI